MGLYEDNVKNTRPKDGEFFREIKCKCGCTRIKAEVCYDKTGDEEGEGHNYWIQLNCKRCGNTLYYNGA